MRKYLVILALASSVLTIFGYASTVGSVAPGAYGSLYVSNVPYCTIGGYAETLQLSTPPSILNDSVLAFPAVVFVHGGAWVNGSADAPFLNLPTLLPRSGFVFVSINYYEPNNQLREKAPGFPYNVEDVACAVRYLRAHASAYHINPEKIGLAGESAGGQLVSLEALSALNGTFDSVGQWQQYSSEVQAVSDAYGPVNLTDSSYGKNLQLTSYGMWKINLTDYVFGGNATNLASASPVNYATSVNSSAPPFMIEQGWNDTLVPPVQSIMLYNALISSGDDATLLMVANSAHSFGPAAAGAILSPSTAQIARDVLKFFERTLEG